MQSRRFMSTVPIGRPNTQKVGVLSNIAPTASGAEAGFFLENCSEIGLDSSGHFSVCLPEKP